MIAELILGAVFILIVRFHWIIKSNEILRVNIGVWRKFTNEPQEAAIELLEVWPLSYMMLELWRWDFKRYIIHHDTYDRMMIFINYELRKKNTDLQEYIQKINKEETDKTNENS